MHSDHIDSSCDGCLFSLGNAVGSNVRLPGPWSLNHYGGTEGFLGWLALQPYWHREDFSKLSISELTQLGPNIAAIERALAEYWAMTFGDPIERLYVNYFLEGGSRHVHIHLIPRFKSLEPELRAWSIPRATTFVTFPVHYRRDNPGFEQRVQGVMDYLRLKLVPIDPNA